MRQGCGHQARMPIVGMHHIGQPAGIGPSSQSPRGPSQGGKAPVVVGPSGATGVAIQAARAFIQIGRHHHISWRVAERLQAARDQAGRLAAPRAGQGGNGAWGLERSPNRAKARQQEPVGHTGTRQGVRQGAHHIGQAARLDQGNGLRGRLQHPHPVLRRCP